MRKFVTIVLVLGVLLSVLIGTSGIALAADGDTARAQAADDVYKKLRKELKPGEKPDKEAFQSLREQNKLESVVVTPDGFEFDTELGAITAYYGGGGDIVIPSKINGYDVVSIWDLAFAGDLSITSVVIPDSVYEIGFLAFIQCWNLADVYLPNNLLVIYDWAFNQCYNLNDVTIPDSVQYIGGGPFSSCYSMTSINVEAGNSYYESIDGVLFQINSMGPTQIVQYPAGKTDSSFTIPTLVGKIGNSAFESADLVSVTMPFVLNDIGSYAFYACPNLASVTIPMSVDDIGIYAFAYCSSLTDISAHGANTNFEAVDGVLFNESLTVLRQYPVGNSATSYSIPSGVTEIYECSFCGCDALQSVTISSGVTDIEDYAFEDCISLTRADMPTSVTQIGTDAFFNCHADFAFYGTLGSYAQSYAGSNGIPFYINFTRSEDTVGDDMLLRTYFNESDDIVCKEYYRGPADTFARIQADYFNMAGTMIFTEIYDETDTIIASVWFQSDGVTKQFKNYYANGQLYFQEEYDFTDTIIASIWFQADGVSRHFKNYYSGGVLYFQEEYDTESIIIASIWFQADGVTRHYKNYYVSGYLYFQEECNVSGTMIASINFREDGTRQRKCYYRVSDGSLYLIEYYDENEDCIYTEWF